MRLGVFTQIVSNKSTVHPQLSEPLWTTSKIFCSDKRNVRISELMLFSMVK